jgi:hypothetical protein|tara:strand:- start:390 stop:644 length:255 start_codon:yes stop_codon:yes gene_type:complete
LTKRNPCRIKTIEYTALGVKEVERRGYAQERKKIDGEDMVFVMEGGDTGIGLWYPKSEVRLTKGKWTNNTGVVVSKKSFWKRAK